MKTRFGLAAAAASAVSSATLFLALSAAPASAQSLGLSGIGAGLAVGTCVYQTNTPSSDDGCQPPPFNVPAALIPSGRINADGMLDPTASVDEVQWGARVLESRLGLFRNFDNIHWVPMTPSTLDDATGQYSAGDLDADGDGRALTIAGQCLFTGHANGDGGARSVQIWRIDDNPVLNPPTQVGELPVPLPGSDESIMGARLVTTSDGKQTIIMARDVSTDEGGLWTYELDPANCNITASGEGFSWGGDMHEFSMWQDPNNPYRILLSAAAYGGQGNPDPYREGKLTPDVRIQAITDETTGHILPQPVTLAHFTLQDVGGPLSNERSDDTGLFSDGRFPNYNGSTNDDGTPFVQSNGRAITYPTSEGNHAHQARMSDNGARTYIAGGTAGFYVLNSEAVANNTNADLLSGAVGCNFNSTNVWTDEVVGGEIDPTKYAEVANDCLHMTINDDPGVKELLAAGNYRAYERLLDKSRFDPSPSEYNSTGMHSAVPVPGRPSMDISNTDHSLPAYIIVTSERSGCPSSHMWMLDIEADAFPFVTDQFGIEANDVADCVNIPAFEYNGQPRQSLATQNHNPTVFKDLVFVSWYAHGVRALDISNPFNIVEVGHAVPAPAGVARSYPVFDNGLMYWVDNKTGLHVARYTGPHADEIPDDAVVEGNQSQWHQ